MINIFNYISSFYNSNFTFRREAMTCYRMENPIFSAEQFKSLNQELNSIEYQKRMGDEYHRHDGVIRKYMDTIRYYRVEFNKGELGKWDAFENSLIENKVIRQSVEVALKRFGQERQFDGEEAIGVTLIKYSFAVPQEVKEGPWHSDAGAEWTMITMLSDPNEYEGGSLQFYHENVNHWLQEEYEEKKPLFQKTAYVQNKAILFSNVGENCHSFEAMKITKPADRIILTLFNYDKKGLKLSFLLADK